MIREKFQNPSQCVTYIFFNNNLKRTFTAIIHDQYDACRIFPISIYFDKYLWGGKHLIIWASPRPRARNTHSPYMNNSNWTQQFLLSVRPASHLQFYSCKWYGTRSGDLHTKLNGIFRLFSRRSASVRNFHKEGVSRRKIEPRVEVPREIRIPLRRKWFPIDVGDERRNWSSIGVLLCYR